MNTKEQTVKITLKEYLEYQELLSHKKEVKIITETKFYDRKDIESRSVYWLSDGKAWVKLCGKLDRANIIIKDLLKQINELEEENYKEKSIIPYYIDFFIKGK